MLKPDIITQIGQQIADSLPKTVKTTQQEIEKNVRLILQTTIDKLDLVSREEFDNQVAVLKRTRSKLEAMEKTLAHLETQLNKKPVRTKKTTSNKKSAESAATPKP